MGGRRDGPSPGAAAAAPPGERLTGEGLPIAPEVDLAEVAAKTEGFSGSDVKLLCKEAAMKPVRRLMARLELLEGARLAKAAGPHPGPHPGPHGALGQPVALVTAEEVAAERAKDPITPKDMEEALRATRPSVQRYADKYTDWQRDFGAV